jgi:hypothetical protein
MASEYSYKVLRQCISKKTKALNRAFIYGYNKISNKGFCTLAKPTERSTRRETRSPLICNESVIFTYEVGDIFSPLYCSLYFTYLKHLVLHAILWSTVYNGFYSSDVRQPDPAAMSV